MMTTDERVKIMSVYKSKIIKVGTVTDDGVIKGWTFGGTDVDTRQPWDKWIQELRAIAAESAEDTESSR